MRIIKKPTVIVRAGELEVMIDALRKLALFEDALGHPEDAKLYRMTAEIHERKLIFKKVSYERDPDQAC